MGSVGPARLLGAKSLTHNVSSTAFKVTDFGMGGAEGMAKSGRMPRRPRDEAFLKRFGVRAADLRARVHLTQQAVAERIGVRPEAISQMESGKLSPTLTSIVALAKALGVQAGALLDFDVVAVADPTRPEEWALLDDYRALPEEARSAVRFMARGLRR